MVISHNFDKVNFDTIPIDEFWNTGNEKEKKMHKIHAYPAKFPAFISTKALQYADNKGVNVNLIADVFCGCGTTALESKRNGKDFWGCDINPVATLIAKTKSNKYDKTKLNDYYLRIIEEFNNIHVDKDEIEQINPRIQYWFKEEQINDLLKLKTAIFNSVSNKSRYLNFFLCAFSNILKSTSLWLTKSIKPQMDKQKIPSDVISKFIEQYQFMYQANSENEIHTKSNVKIITGDFLNQNFSESFVDLIITSPPYVTSYEYADLHQLSTLWLGYTDDYRSFRKGSIGSLYHNSNFSKDTEGLNKTAKEIAYKLYALDKGKGRSAAKFFIDMQHAVSKTYEMLNNNGLALFVIGNTEYKSVRIDNAKHLVDSMLYAGFHDIEVSRRKISKKILTPYRDKKGRFTTDANSRKVYAEEFIIIGRK